MEPKTRHDRQILDGLPSLPQVLLRILDAVTRDAADFAHLARLIRQDAAISARLITIANSSYYRRQHSCDSVEAALSYLGLETVRTLVITAAVKQYFSHFDQQHRLLMRRFWLRSLISAHCAQALATVTSYRSPAEAYLCGLLVDVGQLWLLTTHRTRYPLLLDSASDDQALLEQEAESFATTHCETGARMLAAWQMDNFMTEALRYHHAPLPDIRQGHHLVKIINLSSELSALPQPSEHALAKAGALFGLHGDLLAELRSRIDSDVQAVADDLGIAIEATAAEEEAHARLGDRLSEISQLQTLTQQFASPAAGGRQPDIASALFLGLGIERHLLFILNGSQRLEASTSGGPADFIIETDADSLISHCFTSQSVTVSMPDTEPSVVDRQLLAYCRQQRLICLPFTGGQHTGVLVAGADEALLREQQSKPQYWQSLIDSIAGMLPAPPPSAPVTESPELRRIREAVHEVSNPLSIINNYLEMLRLRFGDQEGTAEDLAILREEIERIGVILLRLREPEQQGANEVLDVNRVIRDITRILEQSLCLTRGIRTELDLDSDLPALDIEQAALKQVLTNLLKNAVEAMPAGGQLQISSRRVSSNGRPCVGITVRDSGAGMEAGIMEKLFQPMPSAKGGDHAGLGLSIVRKLMDSMQAQIFCSSDSSGTEFRLLFPLEQTA